MKRYETVSSDEYNPARDGNGMQLGRLFLLALFTPLLRLFLFSLLVECIRVKRRAQCEIAKAGYQNE